jgi:hypothetical protein
MNLRKAAQITAMQAKPFPCRRYYSRGGELVDTAEHSKTNGSLTARQHCRGGLSVPTYGRAPCVDQPQKFSPFWKRRVRSCSLAG